MAVQVLVGDRFGRVLGEITPLLGNITWRLNKIGKTTVTISKKDAKVSENFFRYGNRLLIQFTDDIGLPAWGGVMDTPSVPGNGPPSC